MMGWFEHRHFWRDIDVHPIRADAGKPATSIVRLEECSCGAIRTIEYAPGTEPIVRTVETK